MASAQQKPKKERGTRNSSRTNGKAFKKPTARGKPSYNSCLGVSLKKFATNSDGIVGWDQIKQLYESFASRRGWSESEAESRAVDWYSRYSKHIHAKRQRLASTEV